MKLFGLMNFISKIFLLLALTVVVCFLGIRFFISRNLIAHALGQVHGVLYTNSLEAFNNSYKQGYRFYEVDLTLTKNNEVVCFHGYNKDIYKKFGIKTKKFSYEDFINGNIFTNATVKFTPLDLKDFIKIMKQNKNIRVLLHIQSKKSKKTTAKVLDKIIKEAGENTEIFDRIFVGVNFIGEIDEIKKRKQFKNYEYYIRIKEKRPTQYSNIEDIISYMKQNNIGFSSVAYDVFIKNREEALIELKKLKENNITVFVFTVNNVFDILKLKLYGVDAIGSDTNLNLFGKENIFLKYLLSLTHNIFIFFCV